MNEPIRVFIADNHPLIRTGIRAIIESAADLIVVGECADGSEAIQHCATICPDVLVVDLHMPGLSPDDTIAQLRTACADTKILVLSAMVDDAYARSVAQAGVSGYILKDEATESVIYAIRAVAHGGTWFSRTVIEQLIQPACVEHVAATADLTPQEVYLLELLAHGWSNSQIAAESGLAEQTVRNYTSRLYRKLGLASRSEAIVWAKDHGFGAD